MKVLVACEESQVVTKEFRKLGHEAYSCDIVECSGGHPEWHIRGDAVKEAYSGNYNLMILMIRIRVPSNKHALSNIYYKQSTYI